MKTILNASNNVVASKPIILTCFITVSYSKKGLLDFYYPKQALLL
jgi:hypothetical protein